MLINKKREKEKGFFKNISHKFINNQNYFKFLYLFKFKFLENIFPAMKMI